jgi:hypothetical protein
MSDDKKFKVFFKNHTWKKIEADYYYYRYGEGNIVFYSFWGNVPFYKLKIEHVLYIREYNLLEAIIDFICGRGYGYFITKEEVEKSCTK